MPCFLKSLLRKLVGLCEPSSSQTTPDLPPVVVIKDGEPLPKPKPVEVTTSCPIPAPPRTPTPERGYESDDSFEEFPVPPTPPPTREPSPKNFMVWMEILEEQRVRLAAKHKALRNSPPPLEPNPVYMAWRQGRIPRPSVSWEEAWRLQREAAGEASTG
ncbi:MAG: hypothetical protein LQ352_008254 [Teloschistes flavicans]|nr:MAG: hypothetical protein LQ352_008254 [Teloschistes flavicans]